MTIHLFCNEQYGAAFAETAARLAGGRGLEIAIVLSGKPRRCSVARGSNYELLQPGHDFRRWHASEQRGGLPVQVVADVNSQRFLDGVQRGDHAVIAGFNQIFRGAAIERFTSFVNFHPAILPCYRGPLPSYWCLKNRETYSGYTLHRVTPAIDAGEILHQEIVPIGDARHPRELDRQIAGRGVLCFERWLDHLATGQPWRRAELDARAIYRRPLDYAPFPDRH